MPNEPLNADRQVTLCDALDRILARGAVIRGEVVLSVAEVDLVYLGVDVLLASVDKAREIGGVWGHQSLLTESGR